MRKDSGSAFAEQQQVSRSSVSVLMADFNDDMDDFDFDGVGMDSVNPQIDSHGIMDDEEEDIFATKKPSSSGEDFATTTILNLRSNLEEKEGTISKLKENLTSVEKDLELWKKSFRGISFDEDKKYSDPLSIVGAIASLKNSCRHLQEKADIALKKENVVQLKLIDKEMEISSLKKTIQNLKLLTTPEAQETRTLLLSAAVHKEFTFLKSLVEDLEKQRGLLKEEVAAMEFTPHSKHGKLLMAKCRTLQEENEEMARELTDQGKIRELETKLGVQKALNTELKQGYSELQEYVEDMNEESDKQQKLINSLQRQVREKDKTIERLSAETPAKKPKLSKEVSSVKEKPKGKHRPSKDSREDEDFLSE